MLLSYKKCAFWPTPLTLTLTLNPTSTLTLTLTLCFEMFSETGNVNCQFVHKWIFCLPRQFVHRWLFCLPGQSQINFPHTFYHIFKIKLNTLGAGINIEKHWLIWLNLLSYLNKIYGTYALGPFKNKDNLFFSNIYPVIYRALTFCWNFLNWNIVCFLL